MRRSPDLARRVTRRPWRRPDRRLSSGGGFVGSVTFPTTRLLFRVMIALGADLTASWLTWSWTDITAYVRFADGIATRTGRPDESSVVTPGRTTLTLDNRDGRFSRRNPLSPYYGLLSKNTPIWVQVDAGSGFKTRVQHYVNEWPTRWDKSAHDCTVTIVASGILRRLGQGQAGASALRVAITGRGVTEPVAYWPMEDGANATQFASAILGVNALPGTGSPSTGSTDSVAGSRPVATFDTTSSFLGVPISATAGNLVVSSVMRGVMSSTPHPTIWVPWRMQFTGGTVTDLRAVAYAGYSGGAFTATVGLDIQVNLIGVVTTFGSTGANLFDPANPPRYISVVATQNGANIDLELWADGTLVDTGTAAGLTLGVPLAPTGPKPAPGTLDALSVDNTGTSFVLGQLSLHDSADIDPADLADAAAGHAGEMAHARIERVCARAGIAYASTGATASSLTLSPQPVGTPLQVIRDAEATDLGVVFETEYGLGYQSKRARYNAPVALALDFDAGHIAEAPEPADDDQRTRNRITASRTDGSEATVEDPAAIAADGLYDDTVTVNTYTDDQLANVASWLVHEGTIDEDRWPAIAKNFTRNPALIDTWCALGYGARMTASNPPDEVAPDRIDAFIEGHAEWLNPLLWRAAVNATPATIFEVYQVSGEANRGRIDTGGSTLTADVTSSDTSLSVASPGVIWVQGAVGFDIFVAGERMTVTNISGSSSPQTFTVTRSVNGVVKAQAVGASVQLWRPGVIAL